MIRVSADSLEEAYSKVAKELNASIVDIEVEILQNPSSGFLGMFSKPAIIKAELKDTSEVIVKKSVKKVNSDISIDKNINESEKDETTDHNRIKYEIKEGINRLLDASCFNVDLIELRVTDELVEIKLDGEDVALLIGKEGYRYKSLSYILHNWIKIKYNLNISLEIAEFLKNQREMVLKYLILVKERVDQNGKAQTKPLDGILVKIALGELRATYPEKYVAIRTLKDGRKIVVINEFKSPINERNTP